MQVTNCPELITDRTAFANAYYKADAVLEERICPVCLELGYGIGIVLEAVDEHAPIRARSEARGLGFVISAAGHIVSLRSLVILGDYIVIVCIVLEAELDLAEISLAIRELLREVKSEHIDVTVIDERVVIAAVRTLPREDDVVGVAPVAVVCGLIQLGRVCNAERAVGITGVDHRSVGVYSLEGLKAQLGACGERVVIGGSTGDATGEKNLGNVLRGVEIDLYLGDVVCHFCYLRVIFIFVFFTVFVFLLLFYIAVDCLDTLDNELAKLFAEHGEESGEASHAHDEVGVLEGILMRFEYLLGIDDVYIEQGVAGVDNAANHRAHFIHALGVVCNAVIDFELHRRGVAVAGLDRRDGIAHCGDCAVLAEAAVGVCTVVYRFAHFSAVRRCLENRAEQNRIRPREEAGDEVDVLGIILVLLDKVAHKLCPELRDSDRPLVAEGVAAAVALAVEHHAADVLAVIALIVRIKILRKLCIGQAVLTVNALFTCGEAVRDDCKAAAVNAHIVVIRTAIGDVDALFDKPVLEQIEDKLRLALGLIAKMVDDAAPCRVDGNLQMLLVCFPKHVNARLDIADIRHHVLICDLEHH